MKIFQVNSGDVQAVWPGGVHGVVRNSHHTPDSHERVRSYIRE